MLSPGCAAPVGHATGWLHPGLLSCRPYGTGAGCARRPIETGQLRFVLSHPGDKNKDVARMGHQFSCWDVAGRSGDSRFPRSENPDLGHPIFLLG